MKKKKVLILGGGAVGAIVANKVSKEMRNEIARDEVEITVLDKNETAYNQGGYTFLPFGFLNPEDITRPRKSLISPRVKTAFGSEGEVTGVNFAASEVTTKTGRKYSYDYLLIATGCEADTEATPGLKDDFNTFYTNIDDTLRLKDNLESLEKGRIVVLTTGMPIPCPGAPGKFVTLIDDWAKNVKGWEPGKDYTLTFLWPLPAVGPVEYNKLFTGSLNERKVNDRREFKTTRIDAGQKQVVSDAGEKIDYDFLITIPNHKPSKAFIESGVTDDKGWIASDKYSLNYKTSEGTTLDNVFIVGDTGSAEILKTGIGAHFQATITSQNIVNKLRGNNFMVPYQGETGCPFVLSSYTTSQRGKAHIAAWTYNNPQKPFKPTELGWFFYRMYYYIYWDGAIKGLM